MIALRPLRNLEPASSYALLGVALYLFLARRPVLGHNVPVDHEPAGDEAPAAEKAE